MSGTSNFAIRLSVAGARETGDALKGVPDKAAQGVRGFGDASARAGGQVRGLRADTTGATPALRQLDSAAKGVGDAFTGIANRIPVIGPGLAAMGPAGLAAAAGIAAIGGALFAMNTTAQKSREYLDDIATRAANIGTSAETFQALTALAMEQDVEVNLLTESLNKLQLGSALAAKGQGELYSTLKRVKPELIDVIATAETQEDRWDALSRAITGTESQLDKVAIAKAAFGEKGAQFIRMLEGEDKTIGNLTQRYKELGLVIDEDVVASVAAADTRLDLLNKRMEIDGVRAGAAMLPVIESLTTAWNQAQIAMGTYLDSFNKIEKQQGFTLIERKKALQRQREVLEEDLALGANPFMQDPAALISREAQLKQQIQDTVRAINQIDTELILRAARDKAQKGAVSDGTVVTDPVEEARLKALADKEAAEEARKRAEAERDLAKALAEQQAAQAKVNAILDAGKTPVQRIYDQIDALTALYATHGDALDGYSEAYARLIEQLKEAEEAEARLADTTTRAISTFIPAAEHLREVERASLEVQLGMAGIVGILDQQIESWEDAGNVALRVLKDIAIQAMFTASQVEGANLGSIIAAGFGVFMGGWGGRPAPSVYNSPGGIPEAMHNFGQGVGVFHSGGVVGGVPPQLRFASHDIFNDAPRNHRGYPLGADERAVIAQVGEPIVAKWDARRIMEAVERGGSGGGVKVNIINQSGGEVETRERRGAGGEREIEVLIKRVVSGGIAAGDFDAANASRYGQRPRVR